MRCIDEIETGFNTILFFYMSVKKYNIIYNEVESKGFIMKRKLRFNLDTIEVILTVTLMVFVCVNVETHWIPFYIDNTLLILFLLLLVMIRVIEYHKYKRNKEGFSLLVIWTFIFFFQLILQFWF